ncbi:MAG: hypothetical protein L6R41_002109 [Letrouitia leprolyta]|nr:MAG: hypothetical protein L6R41_002109 [Letrouitia leprolyta]
MTERASKRRYQTDITTFFNPTLSTTPLPTECSSITLSHALPTSIQASLLNVGMRIRKSVPEGYKTKRSDLVPESSKTPRLRHASSTGYTELVPFCGMVKTGGYDVQSSCCIPHKETPSLGILFECGDDGEGWSLPPSQKSLIEYGVTAPGGGAALQAGKRKFFEEEVYGEGIMMVVDDDTGQSSSVMLAPRPTNQARDTRAGATTSGSSYEGDFEEATLLRSLDEGMNFDGY